MSVIRPTVKPDRYSWCERKHDRAWRSWDLWRPVHDISSKMGLLGVVQLFPNGEVLFNPNTAHYDYNDTWFISAVIIDIMQSIGNILCSDYDEKAQLALVRGEHAFFVKDAELACGDDWDDAPYECNAGNPLEYLFAVRWYGPFAAPCDGVMKSGYSVEDINTHKAAPWLRYIDDEGRNIMAGTTFREFCTFIRAGGGTVLK